jgi:hypothetical protein
LNISPSYAGRRWPDTIDWTISIASRTARPGNLIATLEGDPDAPAVMLFAHMDQLGCVVRKIEPDGLDRDDYA